MKRFHNFIKHFQVLKIVYKTGTVNFSSQLIYAGYYTFFNQIDTMF